MLKGLLVMAHPDPAALLGSSADRSLGRSTSRDFGLQESHRLPDYRPPITPQCRAGIAIASRCGNVVNVVAGGEGMLLTPGTGLETDFEG
jgi:hypothetical protein